MKETPPKIAELVAAAKGELKQVGINIEGKRSDELLNMVRKLRNGPRTARPKPE